MFFEVKEVGFICPSVPKDQFYLIKDNWDDWFEFNTLYDLVYVDQKGRKKNIGGVKIGQFDMKNQKRPDIPDSFNKLDECFFSLGQDVSYYENLIKLGENARHLVLNALRDIALNQELFKSVRKLNVTKTSLLRNVTTTSVKGQYRRLANGDATLTEFEFTYKAPKNKDQLSPAMKMTFNVFPESNPPTNVHILIGRNGVGKTRLLNNMVKSLVDNSAKKSEVGYFKSSEDTQDLFASVVSVTFSAFDSSRPLKEQKHIDEGIRYTYIGLKQANQQDDEMQILKNPEMLNEEFVSSIKACILSAKVVRWLRAVKMLEGDPVFKEVEVSRLVNSKSEEILEKKASLLFEKLSSGHKIVLLTITRLVESVEERTLVLLDEPEGHLHPPLLSAFTRALSDLLIQRNGVAIIATHSPVVLQEVPKSCVWKLRRTRSEAIAERLEIESFGENIGTLTKEVFGLEVTQSGFHSLLEDVIRKKRRLNTVSDVTEYFNGELGMEAQAIVSIILASLNKEED